MNLARALLFSLSGLDYWHQCMVLGPEGSALGSGGGGRCVNLQFWQGTSFFHFSPRNQPSFTVFLTYIVFITAIFSELLKLRGGCRGGGGGCSGGGAGGGVSPCSSHGESSWWCQRPWHPCPFLSSAFRFANKPQTRRLFRLTCCYKANAAQHLCPYAHRPRGSNFHFLHEGVDFRCNNLTGLLRKAFLQSRNVYSQTLAARTPAWPPCSEQGPSWLAACQASQDASNTGPPQLADFLGTSGLPVQRGGSEGCSQGWSSLSAAPQGLCLCSRRMRRKP